MIVALYFSLATYSFNVQDISVNRPQKTSKDVPTNPSEPSGDALTDPPEPLWFTIQGLVYHEVNLTYAELEGFPMVSEVVQLHCVGSGNGTNGPAVTYNWTGVPLFYLLNMAGVIPGTYRKVVFNATDGYSDSVPLDVAMDPTTILALKANGKDLRQVTGFGSDYRIVLPGRWGYKWVKLISQIVVVDYDYNGTSEKLGDSDLAMRPNVVMPQTSPPTLNFTVTGYEDDPISVLTNSTIESFNDYQENQLTFTITGPQGTSGYFYVTIPKQVLGEQYYVFVDQNQTSYTLTTTNDFAYLWLTYTNGIHNIEIEGTLMASAPSGGGACSTGRYLT
jgi:DMSO/TMAO reductase YedYZ molybdopterin-dependent catalytic subunit